MEFYAALPLAVLSYWFLELPKSLFSFFRSFNGALMHILSLQLFIRTFFTPLKNEYRPGLVLFSIVFGMAIKSFFILFDLLFFVVLVLFETLFSILFVLLPLFVIIGVFVL
jgi:hypothetical protein